MNEVRTTFVPRRPTLSTPQAAPARGVDFVVLVATFIFVASVVAAGGVYAWRWSLARQIDGQAQQLAAARDAFDSNFVKQASLLNDRIEAANQILESHLAPTELFEILEQFTISTIAFQTMTAIHQADNAVAVTATGVGRDFESVVMQSDWFGTGPDERGAGLKDVVFSRLGENDRGEATFNFAATIPEERILFKRSISQLPASPSGQRSSPAQATPAATVATSSAAAPATSTSAVPLGTTSL